MNVTEIQARLDAMVPALTAKGKAIPIATLSMSGTSTPYVYVRWNRTAADEGPNHSGSEFVSHYIKEDDLDAMLSKAEAIIAALPSVEEARKTEFTAQLAKTIELGNAYGIDVEFVNPLTEAMKRLSENAITHQVEG